MSLSVAGMLVTASVRTLAQQVGSNSEKNEIVSDRSSAAAPPASSRSLNWKLVLGLSIAGGFVLVFVVVAIYFTVRKRICPVEPKLLDVEEPSQSASANIPSSTEGDEGLFNGLVRNRSKGAAFRVFTFQEVTKATDNFSTEIGEGTYGLVYLARFEGGVVGAAKREQRFVQKAEDIFRQEVELLARVQHQYLVNLIGYCVEQGEHILIFEYMSNGNLYDRLHLPDAIPLPWVTRVRILKQIALGLEYLHHFAKPPIVHRDIKSANILLSNDDTAHIADFGISKAGMSMDASFHSVLTEVKGSFGYLDPEYLQTCTLSTKSDVYGYGVLLLELLTGYRAIHDGVCLPAWLKKRVAVESLILPWGVSRVVDPLLKGSFDAKQAEIIFELSQRCVQAEGKDRPTMADVVKVCKEKLS